MELDIPPAVNRSAGSTHAISRSSGIVSEIRKDNPCKNKELVPLSKLVTRLQRHWRLLSWLHIPVFFQLLMLILIIRNATNSSQCE